MNNRLQDHRRSGKPACRRGLRSTLLAVVLGLLATGCTSSAPKSPGRSFNPLYAVPVVGAKAKEDALRKRVEADPFPAAAKAGL